MALDSDSVTVRISITAMIRSGTAGVHTGPTAVTIGALTGAHIGVHTGIHIGAGEAITHIILTIHITQ